MLVIISDLHLGDGSFGQTVSAGAFQMFATRLADMAKRASFRVDGSYRPIDRIDLVLLGDVLDLSRSSHWLESDVRPWDDTHSAGVFECVSKITDRILRHNATSLRILRALASEGAIRIPADPNPAMQQGGIPSLSIPVRIHYMVGNHDWQLHLPGVSYDMIRQKVSHHLGLANPHTQPFPHDPMESDELMEALRSHRLICRHGDIHDPLNYSEDRDIASLGDALVVELLVGFLSEIRAQLEDELPRSVFRSIAEMDKVRPVVMIPVWIESILTRANLNPAIQRRIKQIWDQRVDRFLSLPLVREQDTWSPFDLVDGLESTLKFSKRLSTGWAGQVMKWLNRIRGNQGESLIARARTEQDFRNRRARHIVYGHTHQFESIPLDASYADSFVLNQVYFNSGTWQRVFQPTQAGMDEHEFIPSDMMSYLAFFQGDERGGRPFETWSGSLGVNPLEAAQLQASRQTYHDASSQSVSASGASLSPPHFAADSASRRSNLSVE